MDADDGKQGQSPHIGNETRQHAATFVGKAGQDRMNLCRIAKIGIVAEKRSHQTPKRTVQRCLEGVSRIEALPLAFPLIAGAEHFSSESERWVTKSRWSERPAMSGGKCSTFWTNANSRRTRWWRWRHAAAWASKCRMATVP